MNTTVIVALMVLFGAALIGKMLMDIYPKSDSGTSDEDDDDEKRSPAE